MTIKYNEKTGENRVFKEALRDGTLKVASAVKKVAIGAGITAGGTGAGAGIGALSGGIYFAKLGAVINPFMEGISLQNIITGIEKGFAIGATIGGDIGAVIGGGLGVAVAVFVLKRK